MTLHAIQRGNTNLTHEQELKQISKEPRYSCPGEYCSLIHVLDPNRDFILGDEKKKSIQGRGPGHGPGHGHGTNGKRGRSLKQSDMEGRERAYKILKRVLTKEELFDLEDSGDVTKLKIGGRIRPGRKGFMPVPRESIERSKREHRVKFLELQDVEDIELRTLNVWENGGAERSEMDMDLPRASESNIQVCEMCFHTYRLLTKARCLQDVQFQKVVLNSDEDQAFGLSQLLQDDEARGNGIDATRLPLPRKNSFMAPIPDSTISDEFEIKESNSAQGLSETSHGKHEPSPNKPVVQRRKQEFSPKNKSSGISNAKVKKSNRPGAPSLNCDDEPIGISGQESQKCECEMKKFAPNARTEIPYCILSNATRQLRQKPKSQSRQNSRNKAQTRAQTRSNCNLVVCHDLFDTFERMQIYLAPFIDRHEGHKILLWNYAGQAYTKFADTECLNNDFHAKCLAKLIDYVGTDGTNEFATNEPFYIMGHGQGGSIACMYAKARQQPSLKGLFLVNSISYVDTHYASVIHDCRNVFQCSPEERPDLPLYFYSRFLFSDWYLKKTSTALALNLYAAVHNPITLRGRIRLCDGALDNVDLRGIVNEVFAPIISLHGSNASLVRPLHAATFLQDRECCSTIEQAVFRKGGKRTVVIMTEGGHELLQEKKKTICTLIEQLLTGTISNKNVKDVNKSIDNIGKKECNSNARYLYEHKLSLDANNDCADERDATTDSREQHTEHREKKSTRRSGIDNDGMKRPTHMLLDPENPTFERQKNSIYKPGIGSNIYPAPDDRNNSQEYMSWRLRRNRKRLSRFQRAARIIQNSLRVYMAKTMMARLKRQMSVLTIQRCYRGMIGRFIFTEKRKELWAARFVQRMYRGSIGRKTSYFKRITNQSQINISRVWLGHVARKRVNNILLHRNSAAINFQTLWRRFSALRMIGILRLRINASVTIQRIYRGFQGRTEADKEREKYMFSRSQSRGIEIGRQMLIEHKRHATRLQSELSTLAKEKLSFEEKVKRITQEILNFQKALSTLEKSMQEISMVEIDLKSSKYNSARAKADISIREKKSRLDEEFSSFLVKISDRKNQLQSVEEKLSNLQKTKEEKEKALKILERKLVALLETQEIELAEIRRRQEKKEDLALKRKTQISNRPDKADDMQSRQISTLDRKKTAQLIDSTETMMKFGFTSMSMTYFTALNMVRAMKSVSADEALAGNKDESVFDKVQGLGSSMQEQTNMYTSRTESPVSNWEVDHVIQWLKALSLGQYEDSFRDGSIDGPFLFQLTDDDLMNVLGVEHILHRKKILFGIAQLQTVSNDGIYDGQTSDNEIIKSNAMFSPFVSSPIEPSPLSTPSKQTPVASVQMKTVELPPSIEDLSRWVRNQKYAVMKESLSSLPSTNFDTRDIRVQFMEDMGTIYEKVLTDKLFHINKSDEHGNTLMHIAAQNGNLRIAKLLIQKGGNPNHQNKQGQTPGHFAVAYQFYDFASWLFAENGGDGDDLILNMNGLGPYDGLSEGG